MRTSTRVIALSLCLQAFAPPTYAWGPKGHRIVAIVAEAHLTDAAKQAIADLLDVETDPRIKTLSDAATWPDLIKGTGPRPSRGTSWTS